MKFGDGAPFASVQVFFLGGEVKWRVEVETSLGSWFLTCRTEVRVDIRAIRALSTCMFGCCHLLLVWGPVCLFALRLLFIQKGSRETAQKLSCVLLLVTAPAQLFLPGA